MAELEHDPGLVDRRHRLASEIGQAAIAHGAGHDVAQRAVVMMLERQHAHAVVKDLAQPRKIPFEEIGPFHRQDRRAFARLLGRQNVSGGQAQPDQAALSASARCGSTASAPEGRRAISASTP